MQDAEAYKQRNIAEEGVEGYTGEKIDRATVGLDPKPSDP